MPRHADRPREDSPALVWFRNDLRLSDHPALRAAAATDAPLFCFHILDETSAGVRPLGGASKWWLARSLASLGESLAEAGGRLHLFRGAAQPVVRRLAAELKPAFAFWNRRYVRAEIAVDEAVEADLRAGGVEVAQFGGALAVEPWDVSPKSGGFYRVYAPWWRAAQPKLAAAVPCPRPERMRFRDPAGPAPGECALDDLDLIPRRPDWAGGLRESWTPGEAGAALALRRFVAGGLDRYGVERNNPALAGSSRLSAHLRFGDVSPRQVIAAAKAGPGERAQKFLQEVAWRDFSTSLLFRLPELPDKAFNPRFASFPFAAPAPDTLGAWREGRTGYPIVDAGMRQVWRTGTMHNRVRMIVASFLVKHLLLDWRLGEAWFWDTLCDADLANNAVNWQWVAGCGPDAAPFFRVFNPVLQGEKFDPEGAYVKMFVPELAELEARWIHRPWEAPADVLARANVVLGAAYPRPIVDHAAARARALAAFAASRASLPPPEAERSNPNE